MNRHIRFLTLAMTLAPMAVMAQDAPRLSAIIASLEDAGYQITDIEVEPNIIEVEARTSDGKAWDIRIDPTNGAVLDTREDY